MPSFLAVGNTARCFAPELLSYACLDAPSLDEAWRITIENLTQIDPYLGNNYKWIPEDFNLKEGELPQLNAIQWEQYMETSKQVHVLPIDPIRIPGEDSGMEWVLGGSPSEVASFSQVDFRVIRASSFTAMTHHLFQFLDAENAELSTGCAPAAQDSFKKGMIEKIAEIGITAQDMANMSIDQFNRQLQQLTKSDYYPWVSELHHITPRTQSQIKAEREAARAAEFSAPERQRPGGVYTWWAFTKDLPTVINCNPNSSGKELEVAFHRALQERLSSIVSNPETIRIISVKRNLTEETECRFQIEDFDDRDAIFNHLRDVSGRMHLMRSGV